MVVASPARVLLGSVSPENADGIVFDIDAIGILAVPSEGTIMDGGAFFIGEGGESPFLFSERPPTPVASASTPYTPGLRKCTVVE
jgi:hypothetical protein